MTGARRRPTVARRTAGGGGADGGSAMTTAAFLGRRRLCYTYVKKIESWALRWGRGEGIGHGYEFFKFVGRTIHLWINR
jgi:hypothetical protein